MTHVNAFDRYLPPHDSIGAGPASARWFAGRCVLVTGAAGFIGSALCRMLVVCGAERLVALDSSEQGLVSLQSRLGCTPALGSVTDRAFVEGTVRRYRPSVILHSAACKHVSFLESNPRAAVQTNALGTWIVADVARTGDVESVVLVSTDKAVRPASIMGASKRVAELVVAALGTGRPRMNAVRLCNVIGSTGSAVPIFLDQIARRVPVTVTHPDATRYFMTVAATAGAILGCASATDRAGRILIPHPGEPVRIADLARFFIERGPPGEAVPIQYTGLRPGEKLHEELIAPDEIAEGTVGDGLTVVRTPVPPPAAIERLMAEIESLLSRDDLAALPETIARAVPSYVPGAALLSACGVPERSAT